MYPFLGVWQGSSRLFLDWGRLPEHVSESTLTAVRFVGNKFLRFDYTWRHEGAAQEGSLLVSCDTTNRRATAAWVDSWHQSGSVMFCEGVCAAARTASAAGEDAARSESLLPLTVQGSYAAPPGPDWGWRISITQPSKDALQLVMHNLSPGGIESLAVQADYHRAL